MVKNGSNYDAKVFRARAELDCLAEEVFLIKHPLLHHTCVNILFQPSPSSFPFEWPPSSSASWSAIRSLGLLKTGWRNVHRTGTRKPTIIIKITMFLIWHQNCQKSLFKIFIFLDALASLVSMLAVSNTMILFGQWMSHTFSDFQSLQSLLSVQYSLYSLHSLYKFY